MRSRKMLFIIHWNVAGEFMSLKNITVGSKEASVGAKGGLLLISFFDLDVVVSPMNVKLRGVLGSTKLIDELRDEGKRGIGS